jgi:hypothetical protein
MIEYAYLITSIVIGVGGLVLVYFVQTRRNASGETKHSWLSFALLWPFILDADQSKREGKFLTKREWLGWGLVGVIVVAAIIFA